MNYLNMFVKTLLLLMATALTAAVTLPASGKIPPARQYYEIRIYHLGDARQRQEAGTYLEKALMPALHKMGISGIGVFEEIEPKDTSEYRLYVLIPYASMSQWEEASMRLCQDPAVQQQAGPYLNGPANKPPFIRMEKIVLKAFPDMPVLKVPDLHSPRPERVYELRSYESPNELFGLNKIRMFNEGGEIGIFDRLEFHTVFCAQVLSGSHMPNLMYMTSFENRASREAHWKAFSADPQWKALSARKEFQGNVSHADIIFLRSLPYSPI